MANVTREEKSGEQTRGVMSSVRSLLPRTIGLVLLLVLLLRIDIVSLLQTLSDANTGLVLLVVVMLTVLIGIKTIRWLVILRAMKIPISLRNSFLAYFAGIFIGFLTPGRLGELGRALYLRDQPNAQSGVGFSSVLADRLFDFYALLLVGSAAVLSLGTKQYWIWTTLFFAVCLLPVVLFTNDLSYNWLNKVADRLGDTGKRLFDRDGWLAGIRRGLRTMSTTVLFLSTILTIAAYLVFFTQCFLLSRSLGIEANFVSIMFAVALGSLITLLPFSISGLGTREATIIAYLSTDGVSAELALSFSFLVFISFYIAGGLLGAAAWLVHPIQLDFRSSQSS